jgi:hypothetical protein
VNAQGTLQVRSVRTRSNAAAENQLSFPLRRSTFWWSLLAVTVLRILVAVRLPFTIDEPYYWLWGQHPALGYYDHPPLAGWLLALTSLLGDDVLIVRAPVLIGAAACAVLVFFYARSLTRNEEAATAAGIAILFAPYYSVMAVLVGPEFALLAAWAWSLYAWHDALFNPRARGSFLRWTHAGLALGVCLLAKFTAFAFVAGLGLFFLIAPQSRRWLRSPWPWTAALIALVVYSPFLFWNARNGWQTFLFQASARTFDARIGRLLPLTGESLLGLSPLIALAFFPAVRGAVRESFRAVDGERLRLPLAVSLPPLLGFFLLGPFTGVQVYWTLCCYIGLFPLLGAWYAERATAAQALRRRRRFIAAVALAAVLLLVTCLAASFPRLMFVLAGRPEGTGVTEPYAMAGVADLMEQEREHMPQPGRTFLAAEDYRLASHLTLLVGPPVLMLTMDRRGLEYFRWQAPGLLAGDDCVLLLRQPFEIDREELKEGLQRAFDSVENAAAHVVRWQGRPARTFWMVRAYGFHPDRAGNLIRRSGIAGF